MKTKIIKYSVPQYEVLTSQAPITIFFGGYGSGKTRIIADLAAYYVTNAPYVVGMIAANTYGQLTRSTLFRVFQVWKEMGIREYNDAYKQGVFVVGQKPPKHFKRIYHLDDYHNVISFINGAIIFTASLDNYKSLDGMEVGYMLLDETKDTKRDAMDILIGRLRQKGLYVTKDRKRPIVGLTTYKARQGKTEINPLYIFTAPAKVDWLYEFAKLDKLSQREKALIREELFNPPHYSIRYVQGRKIVFAATHTNAHNLPKHYIESMQLSMPSHQQEMLIWGYPFGRGGGEFYKYFSEDKHVAPVEYDPTLPLHIAFDENVVPYMPCGVWQVRGRHAFKIAEIDLEPPRNNIHEVIDELLRRFRNHRAAVYVYGDASSRKRDAKLPNGETFYTIIKRKLAPLHPIMRIPRTNPPVKQRAAFVNAIHEKSIYGISITIDPSCKNTIADYKFLKEAADGGKMKETAKDPNTGATYQKYGHDSDLDDYFLCEYFKREFRMFLQGGERHLVDPLKV